MSPRPYQSPTRAARQAEVRQRIAAAAASLHAEKGSLGTSYQEIARRADVALPTVYNHFPTLDDLIPACTGHALDRAPRLDAAEWEGVGDLAARLRLLVRRIFARHRYFHPWMRWGEAEHFPTLKSFQQHGQDHLRGLIAQALAPAFPGDVPPDLLAAAEALLGYGAWRILQHRLPPRKAEAAAHQALLAIVQGGTQPGGPHDHPHR